MSDSALDLRSFIRCVKERSAREYLYIDDKLSQNWELTACTVGLEEKLRVPIIEYGSVAESAFPVVHNICSSLARIARSIDLTAEQLESRLDESYSALISPEIKTTGPVREIVHDKHTLDLFSLPNLRYTDSETHGYISSACLVAMDPDSECLNLSVHRLMVVSRNQMVIYMTPGGHLDAIFKKNQKNRLDTPVAAFIGCHPLWSLGCLAAGTLTLDEYSVIGGLLGEPLEVVPALAHGNLLVPARAEFSLEGVLRYDRTMDEGPYGEAFGYRSNKQARPVFELSSISHRQAAIFQDIVPGHQEHMVMTSVAMRVHLNRTLKAEYSWVKSVHLPAPMSVYLTASEEVSTDQIRRMLIDTLTHERFVKCVIVFDATVTLTNARETTKALALHVQADRDIVILPDMMGNGLDPSEIAGKTTKWGVDATATSVRSGQVVSNKLPDDIVARIDVNDILERALGKSS